MTILEDFYDWLYTVYLQLSKINSRKFITTYI